MDPLEELILTVFLGTLLGGIFGYVVAISGKLTFALLCALLSANMGVILLIVYEKYKNEVGK